jgi:ubiquinone/menaquinone biosynthesis C-methylase UbiE
MKRKEDQEAADYDRMQIHYKGMSFITLQRDLILSAINGATEGPILDIGCGTGFMTQSYVRAGREITALDLSVPSLEILTNRRLKGVTAVHGDATSLPFPECSFGAVIAHVSIQHIPEDLHAKVFSEMFRVLRPGGRLVVTVFNSRKFLASGLPVCGVFEGGIHYYSKNCESLLALARDAGFDSVKVRPTGVFLFLHSLRIRGASRLYHSFHPLWNWIERRIQRLLPTHREFPSEYWFLTAEKR